MEAFLISAGVVALGEIGDKTQLLALMLAARFRRPLPIIAGILAAPLGNHALAGILGNFVRTALPPALLRWAVAPRSSRSQSGRSNHTLPMTNPRRFRAGASSG